MWKTRGISRVQREKLGEIGTKRKGYKNFAVNCKTILETLDEHGPLTYSEIKELTKIPRGNLDRRLWFLKELECIERMDKKYVRHSDIYIYKNKTDRDRALHHSENVASGLLSMINMARYRVQGEPLTPNIKNREHALEHLRTAPEYRETYNLFEEAEEARKKAIEEEHRLREGVKVKLLSAKARARAKLKLVDEVAEIVAREVYEDIKRTLKDREPRFLTDLKVEGGKVKSGAYTLAEEGQFEPLRRFIVREEKSEENVSACERIVNLSEKHFATWRRFNELAEHLIDLVLNGTPLKGKCDLCPKVITLHNLTRHSNWP